MNRGETMAQRVVNVNIMNEVSRKLQNNASIMNEKIASANNILKGLNIGNLGTSITNKSANIVDTYNNLGNSLGQEVKKAEGIIVNLNRGTNVSDNNINVTKARENNEFKYENDGTWNCPDCGRTGNKGNYCGGCAHMSPTIEKYTQSGMSEEEARMKVASDKQQVESDFSKSSSVQKVKYSQTGGSDGKHFPTRESAVDYLKQNGDFSDRDANNVVNRMTESGELKIPPALPREAKNAELAAQHAGEQAYNKAYYNLNNSPDEKGKTYASYIDEANENWINNSSQDAYDNAVKSWHNPSEILKQQNKIISEGPSSSYSLEGNASSLAQGGIIFNSDMKYFRGNPTQKLNQARNIFASTPSNSTSNTTSTSSGITFGSNSRERVNISNSDKRFENYINY